jgi:hypothetical protein
MIFAGNYEEVHAYMNAPRVSFGSEYSFLQLLFSIFKPFTAYTINQVLMHFIAFFGMYLLLKRYIFKNIENTLYMVSISLLFALLPFWPSGGLSVAGQPLITYVFLNIYYKKDTKKDWLVLILFPFYSSFVLSMVFYISFVGLVWLRDLVTKRLNLRFTFALGLFTLLYIFVEYRLFDSFFFHHSFVSHRTEFVPDYYDFFQAIKRAIIHFLIGQYHAASIHTVFAPFVIYMFLQNFFSSKRDKLFLALFSLNLFISIWYGFWKYEGWIEIKDAIPILKSFNFSRYHFLTPFLWYVLFALAIKNFLILNVSKYKVYIVQGILVLTLLSLFYSSDFVHEYRNSHITYKQFYAEKVFDKIAKKIGKPKESYRVVSIGIHPSIARYNGFYTLDGYLGNYPLAYKHQFRKIIAKELEKDKSLKKGFDNWGSRCYMFVADIGYNYIRKKEQVYPISLDINADALFKMGGRYIFSSYFIKNAEANSLKLVDTFEEEDSAWKIYLYKVNIK